MITPQMILNVRYEIGDTDLSLPILSDAEYTYFLTKNEENINKTALDAARVILFKLSIRSEDSTVDIFSIKGSKAAEAYKNALILFITNPSLNKILDGVSPYFGGVSQSDMSANESNTDNVIFETGNSNVEIQTNNPFLY